MPPAERAPALSPAPPEPPAPSPVPQPPRHGWPRWFLRGALVYGLVCALFMDPARMFLFRYVGGKLLRLQYLDKGTMLEPKTTWPRPCSSRESVQSTTTVKVILASVGQTGTTSVLQALRDLGYRSYDIEEKLLFAPELVYDAPTSLSMAKAASRCRVEAIAIEPTTDSLHLLLKASPEAKVIMTWRAFEKWKKSAKASWEGVDMPWRLFYRQMAKSLKIFPWLQVWERLTGQVTAILRDGDPFTGRGQATVLSYVLNRNSGLSYFDSRANLLVRGPFKIAMGEEEYLAHMDEIRRVTPPGRLLEFEVGRHGFAELEQFLGLPPRLGGAPFPHVRSNRSWTNDAIQIQQPVVGRTALVLLLSLHVFHCLVAGALLRCCYDSGEAVGALLR